MNLSFFLNFEPDIPTMTHQVGIRAGVTKGGKAFIYKDRAYENIEAAYDAKLAGFTPSTPFGKNIFLKTLWVFNSAKTSEPTYRNKKPDTDNLVKLLKDRMTHLGYWKDDSYVVREMIEKIDAPSTMKHGVYVWISNICTEAETVTPASTSTKRNGITG